MKLELTAGSFPTCVALMELLSSVEPLVLEEDGAAAEGLAALPTLIRLCSSVDSLMLNQGHVRTETFPTFFAFKWFLPSVDYLMPDK